MGSKTLSRRHSFIWGIFSGILLGASTISTSTLAQTDRARVETVLQWTQEKSGKVTKTYRMTYSGGSLLEELRQYIGPSDSIDEWLAALLPLQETGDQLIKKFSANGTWTWVFERTRALPMDQSHIVAWMPAWEDPLASAWKWETPSRLKIRTEDLEVFNRLQIRGEFGFEGEAPREDHVASGQNFEAHLRARPLAANQQGLPAGMELSSEFRTEGGPVSRDALRKLATHHLEWLMARIQGAVWMGKLEDPWFAAYKNRVFMTRGLDVGFGWTQALNSTFAGFTAGLGLGAGIYLGRGFSLTLAQLEMRVGFGANLGARPEETGRQNWSELMANAWSGFHARWMFSSPNPFEGERTMGFAELYAGPLLQKIVFHQGSAPTYTLSGFAPGGRLGLRLGGTPLRSLLFAGSPMMASIGLRGELVAGNVFPEAPTPLSRIMILMEVY